MSFEQKINYQLNKFTAAKKIIKKAYQQLTYAIALKIKPKDNIVRISLDDKNHEYFFGYYDKSPWDETDHYMLCMKAKDTWSDDSSKEDAAILLIDTNKGENVSERVKVLAKTKSQNCYRR